MTQPALPENLLHRAVKLLSRRAYSRGELRLKLQPLAAEAAIEAVLDRLEVLSLLSDGDYAYNFAFLRMTRDGWGPVRVVHSLLRRHVAPQLAESAVERVRREAGDSRILQEYLQRHCSKRGLPQDRRAVLRLATHLQRRGFAKEVIFDALQRLIPADAWQRFDLGD